MSYTKEQLDAMQDSEVPIEARCVGHALPQFRDWHVPYRGLRWMFGQTDYEYRPQPGFKFSGTIPSKLQKAGIQLDMLVRDGTWEAAWVRIPSTTVYTYRIAPEPTAPAAAPLTDRLGRLMTHGAEIEQLKRERDNALNQCASVGVEMNKVRAERDNLLVEYDKLASRMAKLKAGAAMMQEAIS